MPINRIPKVKSVSGKIGDVVLTSTDVGLGNVNNTSDAAKPIPTAVQTALNAKQDVLSSGSGINISNGVISSTGSLPSGNSGDVLSHNGTGWVSVPKETVVSGALSTLHFEPTVPVVNSTSPGDQYVSGNVLTGATTLTGTLRVTNYKVISLSAPAGTTYTAGVSSTTNPIGTFRMNQDGSWTLTPRLYSSGAMPPITYTVTNGVATSTGTLNLNLTWVNHAPLANPDTTLTTPNTPITINVLANDSDPDGQTMTITQINSTAITAGGSAVAITNGTAALLSNGTHITITPSQNFEGTMNFTYTVTDGSLSSVGAVSVTVASVSNAGTSNWIISTSTLVPFDFAANPLAKGQTVVEPTTGATIRRLTDVTQDFPGQTALYNAYSRYPTENVSGEYALAFAGNSTSCLVIDRQTGAVTAALAYDNSGVGTHSIGAWHEIRWHYTMAHPYRVYYVRDQQLWMIDDVRSQSTTRSMVKDFSTEIDWAGLPNNGRRIYMDQEGNSSLDSNHWAWMAAYYDTTIGQYVARAFLHYEISTDTTHIMYPSDLTGVAGAPPNENARTTFRYRPNTIEMAPDASGILMHHQRAYVGSMDEYISSIFEAPYFWPIDFNVATFAPFRMQSDASHSGWSSVNGAWYLVAQDNRRDKWNATPISGPNRGYGNEGYLDVTLNLSPGVIDFHTDTNPYPGQHYGICTNAADGWAFVSTYSAQAASALGLGNALYMMKIVPEANTVKWHVAPACNQFPAGVKQDYNEAPASINLAGTRIYTCGDWNGTTPINPSNGERYVDLYSIELPTDWASHFVDTIPSSISAPAISGTATQGQTLTYVAGTWAGFPTPTISRNWQRDGVDISGATNTTYVLQAADVGRVIRIREAATNASGTSNAYSNATASIASVPLPANISLPTISGTTQQGSTLTFTTGTWTNSPTTKTFDLLRDGVTVTTNVGNSYVLQAADVGRVISIRENATNAFGTGTAISAATSTITLAQGTITRVSALVSTDPGGSFESSRATPAFDTVAGNLVVVNIVYNQTGGNSITSVTDTAGNTYTATTTGSTIGASQNTVTQQWYCLSSAAKTGNVITATQSGGTNGMGGVLDIAVEQYHTTAGSWSKTAGVVGGTDYAALPMVTSTFNIAANSVAVASIGSYYSNTLPLYSYGDTIANTQQSCGWVLERISGNALTNQSFSTSDSQGGGPGNGGYSRLCYVVGVFTAS